MGEDTKKAKCNYCGKILAEGENFYVLSLAWVTQNDKELWDYEREEDDSHFCLKCASKISVK